MRNHLRSGKAFRRHGDDMMCHGLTGAQDGRGDGCSRNRSVLVVDLVDVGDVRNVYVADVRDVDDLQVLAAVVVPREKGFTGPERKPSGQPY
jgi:hypothetical protein